jgi:hypothetical protein
MAMLNNQRVYVVVCRKMEWFSASHDQLIDDSECVGS